MLGIHDRGGVHAVLVQRSTELNQTRLQQLVAHLAQHKYMFRIDVNHFWQVSGPQGCQERQCALVAITCGLRNDFGVAPCISI